MITRWEELLVEGPGTQKIQLLIDHASDADEAWRVWGKSAKKRAAALGLDEYRKAVHWCYALPETKACFEKEIPIETELSDIGAAGHGEYYSLSALLTATLRADLTETQTSRQWAGRLIAHERALNDIVKKKLSVEQHPLLHQINCAELPWLIGCMFPDLTVGQRMLQFARDNFRLGLAEILDGSGLPHAADFMLLRPLLACWTRALMLGKKSKLRPWPAEEHHQFEWAAVHTFRLTRKDGSSVFADPEPGEVRATSRKSPVKGGEMYVPFEFGPFADMMRHALAFDTDEADHAVARTLFPRQFGVSAIAKTRAALTQKAKKQTDAVKPAKKSTAAQKAARMADAKALKERTSELVTATDVTYFSEWSQMAVLRSGWNFRGPSLTMAYAPINRFRQTLADVSTGLFDDASNAAPFGGWSDQSAAVELNLGGQTIWSGPWNVSVRIDGRTLLPTDTWSTTCEVSEENGCYLEIELPLTENMRLQRHVLLCHKEKLLMLADSILPQFDDDIEEGIEHDGLDDTKYAVEYESQLPLATGINVKSNAETTELLLTGPGGTQPVSRIFPLALPEWKAALESDAKNAGTAKPDDFVSGELTFAGTNAATSRRRAGQWLVLRQNAFGRGMFAPMAFDLDAKRVKEQYTWRQLTVGENLEPVGRDRAAAYRLQIDKLHVLLYHTMTSALNRTFFGHNLVSDFFAGRFDAKTGEVGVIVEAE